MPYRLAMAGIVLFWMVMTGLLIRLEVAPDKSTVLDVPVSYVFRVMFKNGQQSLLTLHEGERTDGSVADRPHITLADERLVDFSSSFSLQVPMNGPQRVSISGTVTLDRGLQIHAFNFSMSLPQQHYRLDVQGQNDQSLLHYQFFDRERLVNQQALPLRTNAILPVIMHAAGVDMDLSALPIMQGGSLGAAPTFSARQTKLSLHGEQLDVFQVTMREGETDMADLYVSYVGQVVQLTTNFGYTLSSDDLR